MMPGQAWALMLLEIAEEGGTVLRLYRGLTRPFRASEVKRKGTNPFIQTDFTDCPAAALAFARGSRGVVLVVEVREDSHARVDEALWHLGDREPRRFIVTGQFAEWIVAEVRGVELRGELRRCKAQNGEQKWQSELLARFIEDLIKAGRVELPESAHINKIHAQSKDLII